MRKINKIINIAIISILIGMFLGLWPAYAGETSLRVPIDTTHSRMATFMTEEATEKAPWAALLEVNDNELAYIKKIIEGSRAVTAPKEQNQRIILQAACARDLAPSLPTPIDTNQIVIHTVDSSLLGLPRFEGATRARDLLYTYMRVEDDGKMHVYVTRSFWDKYLLPWPQSHMLAEILDYGWARHKNNFSDTKAGQRAWYFSGDFFNEASLSPFQYFIIDQYELEEDVQTLQSLDKESEGDLQERFQRYVKKILSIITQMPATLETENTRAGNRLAVPWEEEKCRTISHQIVKELQLEASDKFPARDNALAYGSKRYTRERWAKVVSKPKVKQRPEVTPIGSGALQDDYWGSSFIRIGYLFFLDEAEYLKLSKPLQKVLSGNVILIKNLHDSSIDQRGLSPYTMSAIIAMLNTDIAGKRVIDLGSGDGILSLVAAKLGASSLVLVDIDEEELTKAGTNLKLNGLESGNDYFRFKADLKDKKRMAEIFQELPQSERETVIVSDIGSSPYWYEGTTNFTSILLIPVIEATTNSKVTAFIAGGCLSEEVNAEELKKERTLIGEYGFTVVPERASVWYFGGDFAWIAKREAAMTPIIGDTGTSDSEKIHQLIEAIEKETVGDLKDNALYDYVLRLELLNTLGVLKGNLFYPSIGDDFLPSYFTKVFGTNTGAGLGNEHFDIDRLESEAISKGLPVNYENRPKNIKVFKIDNFDTGQYFPKIMKSGGIDVLFIKGLCKWMTISPDVFFNKTGPTNQLSVDRMVKDLVREADEKLIKKGGFIVIAQEKDLWLEDFIINELGYKDFLVQPGYEAINRALAKNVGEIKISFTQAIFAAGKVPIRVFQKPDKKSASQRTIKGAIRHSI